MISQARIKSSFPTQEVHSLARQTLGISGRAETSGERGGGTIFQAGRPAKLLPIVLRMALSGLRDNSGWDEGDDIANPKSYRV